MRLDPTLYEHSNKSMAPENWYVYESLRAALRILKFKLVPKSVTNELFFCSGYCKASYISGKFWDKAGNDTRYAYYSD